MRTKNFFLTLLLTAMMCVPFTAGAQVTIGSVTPPRATLDVIAPEGTHAGIIVPNVTRERLYNTTYTEDQTGAIVYVVYPLDGVADGQTVNVTEAGLYFFDGEYWQALGGEGAVVGTDYTAVFPVIINNDNEISLAFPRMTAGEAYNYFVMPFHRGTLPSTDLNHIIHPGFYRINVATQNGPVATGSATTNAATLQVMAGISTVQQVLFHQNGRVYSRVRRATDDWSAWRDLTDRGWALGGSAPAVAEAYLGTTNNVHLRFITNNEERMRLTNTGNLGIGTTTPTRTLDVDGDVRIRGGNPAANRVLTATGDAGVAEWRDIDQVGYFRVVLSTQTIYDLTIMRGQVFLITLSATGGVATRTFRQIAFDGGGGATNARLTTLFPVPNNVFLNAPAVNNGNYITLPAQSMHILTCHGVTRTLRFEGTAQMTIHQLH